MGYRVKPFTMAVRDNSTQEFIDVGLLVPDVNDDVVMIKNRMAYYYDTVANMLESDDLRDGNYAYCATYSNHGGEGILYKITDTSNNFTISLTNGYYAEPIINKTAVHVSQFGAVGDGITDDTDAIQNAINYAGTSGTIIIDRRACLISRTLTVDNTNVNIEGCLTAEYRSTIEVPNDSTVSPLIDVRNKIFTIRGVHLLRRLVNRQSLSGIGIRIKHPNPTSSNGWYNMDAYIEKCVIMGFQIGADAYGRNIIFRDDTHFSNCMNGVYYHSTNGNQEIFTRGWIVDGCRFHSLGDEQTWSDPATCPCVAVKSDLNSITREIIIKNNVFDGNCNCMIYYGSSDGLIIDGNTVEIGDSVVFGYVKRPISTVNSYPVLQNNIFNTVLDTNLGVYSDVMLYIAGARVHIKNNVIRNSMKHLVKGMRLDTGLTSLNHLVITGNNFWINQSNTDLFDPTSDLSMQYWLIGNSFARISGATGITMSSVATIENAGTVADCNVKDSGFTY